MNMNDQSLIMNETFHNNTDLLRQLEKSKIVGVLKIAQTTISSEMDKLSCDSPSMIVSCADNTNISFYVEETGVLHVRISQEGSYVLFEGTYFALCNKISTYEREIQRQETLNSYFAMYLNIDRMVCG